MKDRYILMITIFEENHYVGPDGNLFVNPLAATLCTGAQVEAWHLRHKNTGAIKVPDYQIPLLSEAFLGSRAIAITANHFNDLSTTQGAHPLRVFSRGHASYDLS